MAASPAGAALSELRRFGGVRLGVTPAKKAAKPCLPSEAGALSTAPTGVTRGAAAAAGAATAEDGTKGAADSGIEVGSWKVACLPLALSIGEAMGVAAASKSCWEPVVRKLFFERRLTVPALPRLLLDFVFARTSSGRSVRLAEAPRRSVFDIIHEALVPRYSAPDLHWQPEPWDPSCIAPPALRFSVLSTAAIGTAALAGEAKQVFGSSYFYRVVSTFETSCM